MSVDKNDPLIDALRKRIEHLQERVAELEQTVADIAAQTEPEASEYGSMSRPQKVHRIRVALLRDAIQSNQRAAMDYHAVRAVFDNRPSPGHAYNLMAWAADADGYEYIEPGDRNNQLRVDADAVNDEHLFQAANNPHSIEQP